MDSLTNLKKMNADAAISNSLSLKPLIAVEVVVSLQVVNCAAV